MPKVRLACLVMFLALFCGAVLDFHAEGEEHGQNSACSECCVSCCPARHLGPQAESFALRPPSEIDGLRNREAPAAPSQGVSRSIFHPPKSASA